MIKKIQMKEVASYGEGGTCLDELLKVNIIYGGNGTGKTTISNYLSNIEDLQYAKCSCEWKNGDHEKILVYNKAFREKTVLNTDDIPGVFTLGEESVELRKEIEALNTTIQNLKKGRYGIEDQLSKKKKEREEITVELKEWIWNYTYKAHPEFEKVYQGYKANKDKFKDKIQSFITQGLHPATPFEELESLYKKLYSESIECIEPIQTDFPVEALHAIESDKIFQTRIIGKQDIPIADLVNRLGISDWVHKGKDIIAQSGTDICPFCQQHTITEEFKKQIEDYFDEDFANKTTHLQELKFKYDESCSSLKKMLEALKAKIEALDAASFGIENGWFSDNSALIQNVLKSNISLIEAKIAEPGKIVQLEEVMPYIEKMVKRIDELNIHISKHNDLVRNRETKKKDLAQEIWNALATVAKLEVDRVQKKLKPIDSAINGLENSLESNTQSLAEKESELKNKEERITSIVPTINSINELLSRFGFTNFKLAASRNKGYYRIQREDGSLAVNSLSEGEQTFISFLYYMNLVKGSNDGTGISENKILVIDDPVSSLDSDVLFVVSSLLKELLKEVRKKNGSTPVKQVILLTHNVYFHKEVSFIDTRNREKEETTTKYWILRKNKAGTSATCYNDNPIKSSYELLWADLRVCHEGKSNVSVQNIMRKILETYFTVFGGYKYTDNVLDKIVNKDEKEIARSLICWVNEGSHIMPDDLFVAPTEEQSRRYFEVFRNIFNVLGQIGHYNMMMRIDE